MRNCSHLIREIRHCGEEKQVSPDEDYEYGSEDDDRFLHAADIENDEEHQQDCCREELVFLKGKGKKAEDGIDACGNGYRNTEYVVEYQRTARKDAGRGAKHVGGDDVAPAAMGEVLDEAGVRVGDDDNGTCGCQPQRKTEVGVPLKCGECFRWSVGRGGKAICAEPDPRKDRDKGELVEEGRVSDFLGLSEKSHPDSSPQSLLLVALLHGIAPRENSVTGKVYRG